MSTHDDPDSVQLSALDWNALGDEPFEGEQDDDALLDAVLTQVGPAPQVPPVDDETSSREAPANDAAAHRSMPWGAVAILAIVAAVVLFLLLPRTWLGFEGATDIDTLAPDVLEPQAPSQVDPPVHARAPKPSPQPREAIVHATPTPSSKPRPDLPSTAPPRKPPPKPSTKPSTTPDQMLRVAQEALAQSDRRDALAAYQALVEAHPRSAEARAAWISIGRLQLRAGRAKAAIKAFDTYLKTKGGSLRQEARYGRLQAFQKQNARALERREIEAFMQDFPRSLYTARLQTRLEALE